MQIISARILDSTHLELSQPIDALPGDVVQISVSAPADDEGKLWREAALLHLMNSYADEDAVYDDL
jgi:hypothetical protein